jgi:hypothetical protein
MSNTIEVYIEGDQLEAQKANQYSLYLAKKVNGSFTVIWQSMGALATTGNPSYGYKNTFDIDTPSYQVNYTTDSITTGTVTFKAGGLALPIATGQTTTLQENSLFTQAVNDGEPSDILINNELPANPKAILLDANGVNIWVNTVSGMNIGPTTLTPLYEYEIWFGYFQETGTLIVNQESTAATVSMKAGESKTITYTNGGSWVTGEPAKMLSDSEVETMERSVNKALLAK